MTRRQRLLERRMAKDPTSPVGIGTYSTYIYEEYRAFNPVLGNNKYKRVSEATSRIVSLFTDNS